MDLIVYDTTGNGCLTIATYNISNETTTHILVFKKLCTADKQKFLYPIGNHMIFSLKILAISLFLCLTKKLSEDAGISGYRGRSYHKCIVLQCVIGDFYNFIRGTIGFLVCHSMWILRLEI